MTGELHTFALGESPVASADLNNNFQLMVPIGGIIAWDKNMPGVPALPDGFKECDGSVINDAASPMNGETTRNLNGDNRFLRGNSTSGGVGGTETINPNETFDETGGADNAFKYAGGLENRPPFCDVVWIVRIK